jgi:hypothetical protein
MLSMKETELRAKEEKERPAREAKIKEEKDRKYKGKLKFLL